MLLPRAGIIVTRTASSAHRSSGAQALCAKDWDKDLFSASKCYPLSPIPACASVKVTLQGHLEAGGSFHARPAYAGLLAPFTLLGPLSTAE